MASNTFAEFHKDYIATVPERVVLDLDMTDYVAGNQGDKISPFIIVRFGDKTMVLNPMAFADAKGSPGYLDVDVHSFIDGKDASAGVFGMSQGRDRVSFDEAKAGQTSNGWPSANLVVLLLGEQKTLTPAVNPFTGKPLDED